MEENIEIRLGEMTIESNYHSPHLSYTTREELELNLGGWKNHPFVEMPRLDREKSDDLPCGVSSITPRQFDEHETNLAWMNRLAGTKISDKTQHFENLVKDLEKQIKDLKYQVFDLKLTIHELLNKPK